MVTGAKRRLGRSATFVAAVFAVLVTGLPAEVAPGSSFPQLSTAGLTGGSLPETFGKVVLVDFWASWCAPCKASFPAYSRLQDVYASRGLVVVGVSVDENPALYAAFVAKHKPSFATLDDPSHALVKLVEVPTMPTSYLLDRKGCVRFVHAGFHGDLTERELAKEVESLLGEHPSAP